MASTVDAKRVVEKYDEPTVLREKILQLADMVKASKYTVFFTGAGVSTSAGVRDYRGPSGAWTMRRIKELQSLAAPTKTEKEELKKLTAEKEKEKAKAAAKVPTTDALPTFTHMAMATMIRQDAAHYVVTTNLDGIFRKAGLRGHTQLCCLHGDMYIERCTACGTDFERNYHVRQSFRHVHDHAVGTCANCGSATPKSHTGKKVAGKKTGSDGKGFQSNRLVGTDDENVGTKDTHINFGENLDDVDWNEAELHCKKADLVIVMGTSMSLRHITHFPFLARRTVICNLQKTPDDAKADLRIWGTCDDVMRGLLDTLGLEVDPVPAWRPQHPISCGEMRKRGVSPAYIEAAIRLEKFAQRREAELEAAAKPSVKEPAEGQKVVAGAAVKAAA